MHELKRAVRESKEKSAPGEDNIPYAALKYLPKKSICVLLDLYNEVWKTSISPPTWCHSVIFHVLKTGKPKESVTSYRPISLTNTIGKIVEKIFVNRLVYYLEKNKLLTDVQTGFRPGRSALDQLMRLQDTINKYNNNRGYTVGVFIDFQSAYDMLWHDGLMIKLVGYRW